MWEDKINLDGWGNKEGWDYFTLTILILPSIFQYSISAPEVSLAFRSSSSGNGASTYSYVSRSMIWTPFGLTAKTCPGLLSIMGISALASTGLTRLRLTPSKTPIATILALAAPCFPGFDLVMSTMRHGWSSTIM